MLPPTRNHVSMLKRERGTIDQGHMMIFKCVYVCKQMNLDVICKVYRNKYSNKLELSINSVE